MDRRTGKLLPRAFPIGVSMVLLFASVANALNFGSSWAHICDNTTSSQCRADGRYHSVYVNVTGSYGTQIRWAMANYTSVAPPINMYEVFPPALDKDVEVLLTNAGANNALAWTQCAGPVGGSGMQYGGSDASHTRWCRPQRIYYNTYYEAGYFPSDNAKRYIACHELGHTIGLRHWQSNGGTEPSVTCMRVATITPKYVPTYTTTSQHDRDAIAAAGY